MKKQIITSRIQIGTATILFFFIIICLAVFSLLSISDARSSLTFSKQHSTFVTNYYKADAIAQQWLRDVNRFVEQGDTLSEAITNAIYNSPSPSSIEIKLNDTTLNATFSLGTEQEIQVTLRNSDQKVLGYELHNIKEYEIDQSLSVFTGEPEE